MKPIRRNSMSTLMVIFAISVSLASLVACKAIGTPVVSPNSNNPAEVASLRPGDAPTATLPVEDPTPGSPVPASCPSDNSPESDKYYVDNRMIVIGTAQYVMADDSELKLAQLIKDKCEVSLELEYDGRHFSLPESADGSVRYWGVVDIVNSLEIVDMERLTDCITVKAEEGDVIAAPDYYTQSSTGGGAPWPGIPVPTGPGGPVTDANYKSQPAFTIMNYPSANRTSGGSGVTIGIMDTAPLPWTDSAPYIYAVNSGPSLMFDVDFWPPSRIGTNSGLLANPTVFTALELNFPNHGVFVAGIAHTFAPDAKISLYQVLNDAGRGHESDLQNAMLSFGGSAPGTPKVLNLSLVDRTKIYGVDPTTCPNATHVTNSVFISVTNTLIGQGVIVVAAAGNGGTATQLGEQQVPASSPEIIGVMGVAGTPGAAVHRSNFSSCGDTAAAAGEGNAATGSIVLTDAIVSGFWDKGGQYYVGWAGTSFAAPIISAVAARELSQWKRSGCSPTVVSDNQSAFRTRLGTHIQAGTIAGSVSGVVDIAAFDSVCP